MTVRHRQSGAVLEGTPSCWWLRRTQPPRYLRENRLVATVEIDERGLRLRLGRWESLGAMHGDVELLASSLAGAQAVADVWEHLEGVRAPGTGIPGLIMLGTARHDDVKDFCVVYRHGPGLVVDLRDHEFARILISLPVDEATRLAAAVNDLVAEGS